MITNGQLPVGTSTWVIARLPFAVQASLSVTPKASRPAGVVAATGAALAGAGVRVLRENVVIHSGELSQLKRFKDDVREVARGYECGLSFANFHDLREGDVVECFEVEMVPG